MNQRILINGRCVGDLVDGTLIKKGKQVQKMYAMDGFGLAKSLLDRYQIDDVELHYEGKVYEATISAIRRYGIPYHNPRYEPQLIVPASRFRVHIGAQTRLV